MSERPLFRQIRIRDKDTGEIRVIEGGDIGHCSSPIAPLLEPITRSVAMILPERRDDIRAQIEGGTSIEIDGDREDFYIAAHVPDRKVILGLAALERIWAYTYFYLAIDDIVTKHPRGTYLDLTGSTEIQPARGLARWALACEKNKSQTPWPAGLPRPDINDGSDARIDLTKNYFLHAICFLALHEIGHIHWEHPTTEYVPGESYKWELQADEWAADFMLKGWPQAARGNSEFTRRYTGIVLGLALLAGVELHHHEAKNDHPTVAERLLTLFAKYDPQSVGPASAERDFPVHFASAIIHWHLMNANITFAFQKEYADITEYLIAAHRAMAEHKDR